MSDRWTAETEDLVAHTLTAAGSNSYRDRIEASRHARLILIALADAGLLLPPGGETREEWAAQIWADGEDPAEGQIDQRPRREAEGVVEAHAKRRAQNPPEADATARRWFGNARLMIRTVHIGPWVPVNDGGGT